MANNSLANIFAETQDTRLATPGMNRATIFSLLAIVAGLSCGVASFIFGHEAIYNNTREVPWGMLISTYAFWAITSTGLCIYAAISHLFGGTRMAIVSNRMVWMSIVCILAAFATIGVEIASPHRMIIYNILSPNPTSNIWWMGTLYGLAVGCMIVEFFGIITGLARIAVILGTMGAVAEILANSCLGGVFATLPARPYWYGGQLPIYFLTAAFLSGAAATILFNHLAYKIRKEKMSEAVRLGIKSAGKAMTLVLVLYTVATFWRLIMYYVGGAELGRIAAGALISGPLSINFWVFEIAVGLIVPLLLVIFSRLENIGMMAFAGLLILIGQFVARYDLVVAGLIVPESLGWDNVPTYLDYVPSIFEFGVIIGSISVVCFGFLMGERVFGKIFEQKEHH
ncbi:MAG: polysulfide reductase NrfD [Proteobacteria bacterium]|nr:polysulfide reductase NrfD [Pseudomonadota bacterium]MBU1416986.1 polysulfide reductase NrfD [Pseudomonadota bacterium]MBU1453682.1 polysulfide reductase NrfD [Pseudomonadota bacterium]